MSTSSLGDWQHSVDAYEARAPGKRLRHRRTGEPAAVKAVFDTHATLILANGEECVVRCPEFNLDWQPEDDRPSYKYEREVPICQFTIRALEAAWALEPDRIVARRPDGAPVTAAVMLGMLREGAPGAQEFVQDLHSALLRMLGAKARSPSSPGAAQEAAEAGPPRPGGAVDMEWEQRSGFPMADGFVVVEERIGPDRRREYRVRAEFVVKALSDAEARAERIVFACSALLSEGPGGAK